MSSQLSVENLIKTFDDGETVAVDDVSFTVGESEIFCLLGPSGCGKTTTLRCIAGVETPDTGRITIGDQVVYDENTSVSSEDRDLGMVYQSYAIWPHKSVYENVVFPLKYNDYVDKSEYETRVEDMLELVKIPELKNTPATDLSGGQQQRTALARALVHNPKLLLLDEPLSNLDAKLRSEMRNEIQRIQQEVGVTIVYVTHDQEEAFYLADKIAIMQDGKIIEIGDPSELYNSPRNAFTRDFVGQWNRFSGVIEGSTYSSPDFTVELDGGIPEGISDGEDVWCFVRPTEVSLTDTGSPDVSLRGTVIAEGVIGELYEMTVHLDGTGTDLTVQVPEHLSEERGSKKDLYIDRDALHIYRQRDVAVGDESTGSYIDSAGAERETEDLDGATTIQPPD